MRYEITYPFPNFNGYTVEVWERISNITPHFITNAITSIMGLKLTMLVKMAAENRVPVDEIYVYSKNSKVLQWLEQMIGISLAVPAVDARVTPLIDQTFL